MYVVDSTICAVLVLVVTTLRQYVHYVTQHI